MTHTQIYFSCKTFSEIHTLLCIYFRMTKESLEVFDHEGASAIHLAADQGHSSIVEMFVLERGVDINQQGGEGEGRKTLFTPLHCAVFKSRLDTVSFLLSRPDCNPSIMDASNQTPLHYAVREIYSPDAEKILQLLLSHWKVDVNHRGTVYTPFQMACIHGKLWSLKILMSMPGIICQWGQEEEGENGGRCVVILVFMFAPLQSLGRQEL